MRHSEIEIHHPNGHITKAKIDLSEFDNYHAFLRMGKIEEYLNEVLEHVWPQTTKGTEIFLIIKSKANNEKNNIKIEIS